MTRPRMSLAHWLGPALDRVRLNAVEHRVLPGGLPVVAKRRFWYSPLLIPPGNLYLRWLRAGVAVLDNASWQARERAIHRQVHGLECLTDAQGWLILPAWPGVTGAEFVGDSRQPVEARLDALVVVSQALEALHQVRIAWPGDPHEGAGHGDAMLRNVQYDSANRRACWFDFDMIHRPDLPALDRLADDLRALLYSALATFIDAPVADLYAAVRGGYRANPPWQQLRANLLRGPIHWSPFHYAQARPTMDRQRQVEQMIRKDVSMG